ncbi:MAG TPA: hypothetical protein VKT31_03805 [Solirubrobacteraceae bacterium]|nr:hypothetical protein [Solirubrobacteraceae bacterium]
MTTLPSERMARSAAVTPVSSLGRPAPSLWRARSRQLLAAVEAIVLLALLLNILSLGTGIITAWAAVGVALVLVVTIRVMHVDGDLDMLSSRHSRQKRRSSAPAARRRPATDA